jgi:hypothetical protein
MIIRKDIAAAAMIAVPENAVMRDVPSSPEKVGASRIKNHR